MQPVPATTERDAIVAHLRNQHDALLAAVVGLSDADARRRSTVSELTLIDLLAHVTAVQRDWRALLHAAPGRPSSEAAEESTGWPDTTGRALADVVADLERENAATLDELGRVDLDTLVPAPPAPWFADIDGWPARSVGHHLVQELARHAGHADILREAIDGEGAFVLDYRRRGEPIPEFLQG